MQLTRTLLYCVLLVTVLTPALLATPITFLNFTQANPLLKPFIFTNTGAGGTLTASDVLVNINIASNPLVPLLGPAPASGYLTMAASTGTPAFSLSGILIQPVDGGVAIAIRTAPGGGGDLILGAVLGEGSIAGLSGGSGATFFDSGGGVSWSSDVIDFVYYTSGSDGVSQSYTGVTPTLALGAGGYLRSFGASGTGTFSAAFVPEPSSWGLGLAGSLFLAGMLWRRRRKIERSSGSSSGS